MSTKASDMAFPVNSTTWPPNGSIQLGLTKREYFAAMAMQGFIAGSREGWNAVYITMSSVVVADALIAELSKVQP